MPVPILESLYRRRKACRQTKWMKWMKKEEWEWTRCIKSFYFSILVLLKILWNDCLEREGERKNEMRKYGMMTRGKCYRCKTYRLHSPLRWVCDVCRTILAAIKVYHAKFEFLLPFEEALACHATASSITARQKQSMIKNHTINRCAHKCRYF